MGRRHRAMGAPVRGANRAFGNSLAIQICKRANQPVSSGKCGPHEPCCPGVLNCPQSVHRRFVFCHVAHLDVLAA